MKTYCKCYSCGALTFYAIEPAKCPTFCKDCRTKEVRDEVEKERNEPKPNN